MRHPLLPALLSLLLLLNLCGPARAATPPPATGRPLAEALNSDGTLKAGLNGSFDARAFRMRTAPDGRPVFRPAGTKGAGDERWADGFGVAGTDGQVATVVRAGTDIYIGGPFNVVNNIAANGVAKWNGAAWSSLGTGTANGVNGAVQALAFASNGDVYAGGTFDRAGGGPANNVARWNGTAWSALGAGVSGPGNNRSVRALAIAANGDVYVGGDFATAGGAPANNVACWNGTAWSSLGAGTTGLNPSETFVAALAIANNGDVYAGGTFDRAGGVAASNVARWNGTAWSSLGTGTQNGVTNSANVWITRLIIASNGTVYAGGFFNRAGGAPANGVAKWNGTAWSGLGAGPGTGDLFVAEDLAIASKGDVYAGGWFSTSSNVLTSGAVAKWNGTAWTILGTGTIGTSAYAFFTGLTLAANGDVYVSGSFTHINGVAASNVARWNGTAWSRLGTGMANGIEGVTDYVTAVAIAGNGDVYAAGSFSVAGGVPANNVARWNGTAWNALGMGTANGVNGTVRALAVANTGDVYVGGFFTAAGGVAVNSVAHWNGTAWSSVGSGLVGSGYRNPATVNALAVASNGNVYVGGTFVGAGSVAANNVAMWNGTAWSSLGTGTANGVSGSVGALAVASTGDVYAGGASAWRGGMVRPGAA